MKTFICSLMAIAALSSAAISGASAQTTRTAAPRTTALVQPQGAEAAPSKPASIVVRGVWHQGGGPGYNLAAHVIVTDFATGRPLDKLGNTRGNGDNVIAMPPWWRIFWFPDECALAPTYFQNKGGGVYWIWFNKTIGSQYACQVAERRKYVIALNDKDRNPLGAAFVDWPKSD